MRTGSRKQILSPLAVAAVLLAGCATPSTTLVNQDMQAIRCIASSSGRSGTPQVLANRDRCVREFKRMGYLELPDVVLGVKLVFTGAVDALGSKRAGEVLPVVVHRGDATLEFAPVLERR